MQHVQECAVGAGTSPTALCASLYPRDVLVPTAARKPWPQYPSVRALPRCTARCAPSASPRHFNLLRKRHGHMPSTHGDAQWPNGSQHVTDHQKHMEETTTSSVNSANQRPPDRSTCSRTPLNAYGPLSVGQLHRGASPAHRRSTPLWPSSHKKNPAVPRFLGTGLLLLVLLPFCSIVGHIASIKQQGSAPQRAALNSPPLLQGIQG